MNERQSLSPKSLLPNGLRDTLAPEAAQEARVIDQLLSRFQSHGYDRIDPPLVEFEENLLDGVGAATGAQVFRLMDPVSQRMMGVRSDITPQAARIAATRLASDPRPLRLTYAGSVLRVKGTQLRPERQFRQAGCELIGADTPNADSEVIAVAVKALEDAGVKNLSVDISMPTLVASVCDTMNIDLVQMREALDKKDAAAVASLENETDGGAKSLFSHLLGAVGPAEGALSALKQIDLPEGARAECDRLEKVVAVLHADIPDVAITVDPVEHRGFEYQQGLSFTLFSRGARGELGRGGRYWIEETKEAATGFTLYLDTILRVADLGPARNRILVPVETSMTRVDALREEGWTVLRALDDESGSAAAATMRGIRHVLVDGKPIRLVDGQPIDVATTKKTNRKIVV